MDPDDVERQPDGSIDGSNATDESEGSDANSEYDEAEKPAGRARATTLMPGVDEQGQPLPTNNTEPYNVQQRHVLNAVMKQEPRIKEEFDACKTRDAKRAYVNSLIPSNVSYACRINVAAASSWVTKFVKVGRERKNQEHEEGRTLTQMEKDFGTDLLKRGLARGDVRLGEDGFYYTKSKFAMTSNHVAEEGILEAKHEADAAETVAAQDT